MEEIKPRIELFKISDEDDWCYPKDDKVHETTNGIFSEGECVLFPCAMTRSDVSVPEPGVLCAYLDRESRFDFLFFSNNPLFEGGDKSYFLAGSGKTPYPCGLKYGWHVGRGGEELFILGDSAHEYFQMMAKISSSPRDCPAGYSDFLDSNEYSKYRAKVPEGLNHGIGFAPEIGDSPFYLHLKDLKLSGKDVSSMTFPVMNASSDGAEMARSFMRGLAASPYRFPSFDSGKSLEVPVVSDLVEKAKAEALKRAGLPVYAPAQPAVPLSFSRRNASIEAMAFAVSEFGKIEGRVDEVAKLPAPDGGHENAKKEWDALKSAALRTVSSLSESFSDDPQAKSVCDVVLKWMEIQEEPESAKAPGQGDPKDGGNNPSGQAQPGPGDRPSEASAAGKGRSEGSGQSSSAAKGPFGKRPGCYPDDVASGFKDAALAAGYRIKGESVGDLRLIWGKLSGAYPTGFYLVPGSGAVSAGQYERAMAAREQPKAQA